MGIGISLLQGIHRAVQQRPNGIATRFGSRTRTWADHVDRAARLAAALQKLGMTRGERVGMLALNSDRYFEYYVGTWWGGGVLNPCNVRWSAPEIAYSLDDCATKILLVDDAFVPMLDGLRRAKCIETIIHVGDGPAPAGLLSYEALLANEHPIEDAHVAGDEMAGIFYTGGTTGQPKGVVLSHENIYWSSLGLAADLPGERVPVYLHAAPMFHMADGAFSMTSVIRGATHAFVPSFTARGVLAAIAETRTTITLLVPTMVQMTVDSPDLRDHDLSSLRTIVYGASPISEAVLRRAMAALPGVQFVQAYGMTELSPLATVLPGERHVFEGPLAGKSRSAGRAGACTEVKIVDANDGDVPRGAVGEIAVRGPNVMAGYWNKPELTAQALRGGWMHTGDAGYLDEDGFLFVVDRVKDMIITGGENVYSAEVENALMQHPAVAMCAVIAVPDAKWGERVHAVVVPRGGASVTAEELIAHCHALIAHYKAPRSVELRAELPISGAGKILKTVLREPYWRGVERGVG